jgi:hypothetical protein
VVSVNAPKWRVRQRIELLPFDKPAIILSNTRCYFLELAIWDFHENAGLIVLVVGQGGIWCQHLSRADVRFPAPFLNPFSQKRNRVLGRYVQPDQVLEKAIRQTF